jgi:hypothetical protein
MLVSILDRVELSTYSYPRERQVTSGRAGGKPGRRVAPDRGGPTAQLDQAVGARRSRPAVAPARAEY